MIYPDLFVGIDVSKLKHDVAIMNESKKMVSKKLVIENSFSGFQFLLETLNQLSQKFQTQTLHIAMEATGDYWKNLYYFLKRQLESATLTVINPVRTKAFAKTELRRAKTDAVNAKDIAQFVVEKRPEASVDRPPVFDNIKDIDRQIYLLKKQQTMMTNKLRIELEKVAPEIEKAFKSFQGQQILALLAKYPTAAAIRNTPGGELAALRYGKNQWRIPKNFIEKVKSLSELSIAYKQGAGAGLVVQSLVRRLGQSQQEVQSLKNEMVQLYDSVKEQDSILMSIPGITRETAIVLEAYIGDINRFGNAKQLIAYFGMNPTVNESGKSKRKSYLQKKGSPIVRHKLFMVTIAIISKHVEPFYSYFNRLVEAGKPKLVAICATMRKLLAVIFALLKNKHLFEYKKSETNDA